MAGRYLESLSKQRTGDAISELNRTKASTGMLVSPADDSSNARVEEVDAVFVEVGEQLLVPTGSSPPLDGTLIKDSSPTSFDESALTGESRPVLKQSGDNVFAGTINAGPTAATLHVTSSLGSSMVDSIANAVRDAMGKKAGVERIADVVTAYFVPAIVGIACFTLAVWLLRGDIGDLPREWLGDQTRPGGWALFAIEFAVAVLVVACPCGAFFCQLSARLSA